jgi:hypothetical protein
MPEEGKKLIMENIAKNFADQDEYPATMAIHTRCVSMREYLLDKTCAFFIEVSMQFPTCGRRPIAERPSELQLEDRECRG